MTLPFTLIMVTPARQINSSDQFKRSLKSDSQLPKQNFIIYFNGKSFKNDEKGFLFHLKSSFRSQDI